MPSFLDDATAAPCVAWANQLAPDLRVLTMQEPYAWLLVNGFKDAENRKWHSKFSGRIFIHSAKTFAPDFDLVEHRVGVHQGIMLPGREWFKEHSLGRVVGVAEFQPMQNNLPSWWYISNRWTWPVRWAYPLASGEIVRGALGLWRLDYSTHFNLAQ